MNDDSTAWPVGDENLMIAIAGDWHSESVGIQRKLMQLADIGITRLHHAGDFAIWPDRSGRRFLDRVNGWAADANIRIVVTPGNHEDWAYLRSAFDAAGIGLPADIRSHISVLPRGYRWTQADRSLMSFGGAPSIDRDLRIQGVSWWPEELPTEEDVAVAIAEGPVDVLILHDSPEPATPKVATIRSRPSVWGPDAVAYARQGSELVTEVWEATRPLLTAHGHFHVRDVLRLDTGQKIVSLAHENERGNVLIVDLTDLTLMWLEGFDH